MICVVTNGCVFCFLFVVNLLACRLFPYWHRATRTLAREQRGRTVKICVLLVRDHGRVSPGRTNHHIGKSSPHLSWSDTFLLITVGVQMLICARLRQTERSPLFPHPSHYTYDLLCACKAMFDQSHCQNRNKCRYWVNRMVD